MQNLLNQTVIWDEHLETRASTAKLHGNANDGLKHAITN